MSAPDGIRLEQVSQRSQRLARAAWEYMQACKLADKGYTAGLGCLEDCRSEQEVEDNWVQQTLDEAAGKDLPEGWVPALQWLAVNEDGRIVAMIQLRLELTDFLLNYGGNIGYSVHPDFRRRGYAHSVLEECLRAARERGLNRVLVTCRDDNEASWRTIVSCGGRLEDTRKKPGEGPMWRYWIDL